LVARPLSETSARLPATSSWKESTCARLRTRRSLRSQRLSIR
jgi:hypothetical protein